MTTDNKSPDVRSWEPMDEETKNPWWLLCLPFGDDRQSRVSLSCWSRTWCIRHVVQIRLAGPRTVSTAARSAEWRHGDYLRDTEGISRSDVRGAMRWALDELAALARDRAVKYTEQGYRLMVERVELEASP